MALIELRGGKKEKLPEVVKGKGKGNFARGRDIVGYAVVNDDIAEIVGRYSWSLTGEPNHRAAYRTVNRRTVFMHRFIYKLLWGFVPSGEEEIDHIDRNPLNNLDSNLRRTTKSFNNANKSKSKYNKSGYGGVSWSLARKKWNAFISIKHKGIFLGRFENKEDAARAVNAIPNPEVEKA